MTTAMTGIEKQLSARHEQNASETVRLNAWRSVFERTNRIITGEPVRVEIAHNGPAAGWSDGRTVYFNAQRITEMLKTTDHVGAVLRLKGLNYHELSHILYTPRSSDELTKQVRDRASKDQTGTGHVWFYALNALEDQRIESLFSAVYGPSRRYFEAMILEWVIRHGTSEAAILIHGRKYLPARLRIQADRIFAAKYGDDLHGRFVQVIEEYLSVVYPQDTSRGLLLIGKYKNLLMEMQNTASAQLPPLPVEDNGSQPSSHGRGGDAGFMTTGRPDKAATQEAQDAAQKQKDEIEQEEAEAKADLDAEAAEKAAQGTGQGDGDPDDSDDDADADGGGQGGEDGTPGAPSSQGSGQSGGQGKGIGNESPEAPPEIVPSVGDLVNEAHDWLDDVHDDEFIQNDAENVMDAVRSEVQRRLDAVEGVRSKTTTTLTPGTDTKLAVRRIAAVIQRLQNEAEPSIQHRQRSGRVDITRVINSRPEDLDIFRSYDAGQEDSASLEVVCCLDVSGSMQGRDIEQASEAVWVLKRALDKLDIKTTVIVFNTQHYVLYQPSERAPSRVQVVRADGGTDPNSAFEQAALVLRQSDRANKVLVTVTDGGFGGAAEAATRVKAMNKRGIHTLLLGIGTANAKADPRGHMMGTDLKEIKDLPKVVTALVEEILKTAINVV